MKGAEALLKSLKEYEVRHIFGLPGDTSVPLYDALYEMRSEIGHIMTRDERGASFMADAYARVSFRPGVCDAPSGGGALYMLPGIAEAYGSSIPVVAITTDIPAGETGKGTLTELDQQALFAPITKWTVLVTDSRRIPEMVRKAFRVATGGRPGPVHLGIPKDVLEGKVEAEIRAETECSTYPSRRTHPDPTAVAKAADLLVRAGRPVMVVGGGAVVSQAWGEVAELAELIGFPVGTTLTGKGAVREDHPLSLGVVGDNGARPYANRVVEEADLVLFVGCKTGSVSTRRWRIPRPGTRIVQIDVDPTEVGKNFETEVGVVGDAKFALRDLIDRAKTVLKRRAIKNVSRVAEIRAFAKEWLDQVAPKMRSESIPIKPQRVMKELRETLPKDSLVVADAGTGTSFGAAYLDNLQPGRSFICFRAHGGLGYAVPGAIGAKLAAPHRTVIGLSGDGGFAFSVGELETARRAKIPFTVIVFNNGSFGWIKTLQRLYYGERYMSVDFSDLDYAKVARSFGCRGIRVERPNEVREALKTAFSSGEPTIIDIVVEPLESELPPVQTWIDDANRMMRR
jgi:acetolactate synthase-1/2/3 large subunit